MMPVVAYMQLQGSRQRRGGELKAGEELSGMSQTGVKAGRKQSRGSRSLIGRRHISTVIHLQYILDNIVTEVKFLL